MAIPEDLAGITRQETELRLPGFDHDTAWRLGLSPRAGHRPQPVHRGRHPLDAVRRKGRASALP